MMSKDGTRKAGNGPIRQNGGQVPQPPIGEASSQPVAGARKPRRCPDCGAETPLKKRGVIKIFCDGKCRARYHARSKARGQPLVPLLLAWRHGRGASGTPSQAFQQLVTILDTFISEDRQAGRPPAAEYAERLMWMGQHMDRRRR